MRCSARSRRSLEVLGSLLDKAAAKDNNATEDKKATTDKTAKKEQTATEYNTTKKDTARRNNEPMTGSRMMTGKPPTAWRDQDGNVKCAVIISTNTIIISTTIIHPPTHLAGRPSSHPSI